MFFSYRINTSRKLINLEGKNGHFFKITLKNAKQKGKARIKAEINLPSLFSSRKHSFSYSQDTIV